MDSSVSPERRNVVSARVPSHFNRGLLLNLSCLFIRPHDVTSYVFVFPTWGHHISRAISFNTVSPCLVYVPGSICSNSVLMSASVVNSPSPPLDSEASKCFESLPLATATSVVLPAGRCGVCSEEASYATRCKGKRNFFIVISCNRPGYIDYQTNYLH